VSGASRKVVGPFFWPLRLAPAGPGGSRTPPKRGSTDHLAWMYPSAVSSSAVSTAPPAAPRTVLCERQTKR
jgi:hypothetical protein